MKRESTQSHTNATNPFASVAESLNAWRATRRQGQRIPEDLWQAAAELARLHGLNPTATALRLSYYDLKRRLDEKPGLAPARPTPLLPGFVELPPPNGGTPVSEPGTLELTQPSGARLSLRLPAVSSHDLSSIIEAFLRS